MKWVLCILGLFVITGCQTSVAPGNEISSNQVHFASGDGTEIDGYLYRPPGDGPRPALVLLHGCGGLLTKSGRMKKREAAWRDILLAEGYVLLFVDSFNPRGHREICKLSRRPILPERERPHDVFAALSWLQKQPFVDPARVGLFGWSNGAMALLWTIRRDAVQRPANLENDFKTAIGFYPGCIAISRTDFRAAIPTLLQVGLADTWTKPIPCLNMVDDSNDSGGVRMEIDAYPDAAHGFDHPNSKPRKVVAGFRSGSKKVSVGTNKAARAAAIERVLNYLRAALNPA